MREVGVVPGYGRRLCVGSLSDVGSIDESMRPFIVFTALDASSRTGDDLYLLAHQLLEKGCVYSCSWGPESRRVEDAFDEEAAEAELAGRPYVDGVVMTTSHEGESLDEALWFALFAAVPAGDIEPAGLVVVADGRWSREIERHLSDPARLNADVIARDERSGR